MIISNKNNKADRLVLDEHATTALQPNTYKIDDVLAHFGTIGRFQIKLIIITAFLTCIAAWRILFDLFSAKSNTWHCTEQGIIAGCINNGTMPCENNDKLESDLLDGKSGGAGDGAFWKFNDSSHSIQSTFLLPCSENWKYSFTSSIYFIGAFFGVWMFGRLSDMIGRRKTLLISLSMCVAQAWIIPFFNDINVYLACRFIDGAAFGGFFLIAFVLEVEYAPPKYRNTLGTAFHFVTSIGMATVAIWGYVFKAWRWYAAALAVPPTIMLPICFFFIPESPRYFLSKGNDKEALALLQKVAKMNGKSIPENCQLYEDVDAQTQFVEIIKDKRLVRCALINMFGWFMTSLVYYMLWFSAKYLAGNIYLNAALLGAAELPGRVVAFFAMETIGRVRTFMITIALACVCMLVSIYDNPLSRKMMYCFGKALSGALWAVIYLYSSEMYPTKIRNLGSGIGSASARVAALVAPFIGDWLAVSPVWPYLLVGALAFLCCGAFFFVPETSGKDLPQTLEEFNMLFTPPSKKDKYANPPEKELQIEES